MYKIIVFLYCYKNKNFYDIVQNLQSKASNKNNIIYAVYDQSNEDKTRLYAAHKNITYQHIFWDRRILFSKYRNDLLDKDYDYFLEIGNLIDIKENWDEELIMLKKNNNIVLSNDINFLDLIFIDKKNSYILKNISNLSFYGQHIYLLYTAYINNIDIKHIKNCFASFKTNTIVTSDYFPYSLYNQYNEMLEIIKNNTNFLNYIYSIYGIDLSLLTKKYYQETLYDYSDLNYDSDDLKTTRFNRIKKQMVRSKNIKDGV